MVGRSSGRNRLLAVEKTRGTVGTSESERGLVVYKY